MKKPTKNKPHSPSLATIAVGLLMLGLLSACAPPSSSNSGLANELSLLKQQQQEQQQALLAIQQQLALLQGGSSPIAVIPGPATATPGIESQPGIPILPQAVEVENLVEAAASYLEAFSALAMGRYEQAQNGFSTFLQKFMEHRYAPNARYWLAETEISLGLSKQAEDNLLMVANDPASKSKSPAALSRLAQLYQQQNQTEQAVDILQQLRTRFPESREAQYFNRSDQAQ